jgi:UDP-glucose 4-epimerase
LAAIHHIPTCEQNASEALRVNIVGFQIVLDAAAKVGCQRMILASSGAIYDWQEGPLNEDRTPVKPRDIYSLSKATNEKQLEFWTAKTGATAIVARIFNTIGENDPNRHLIPDILRQVDSNGRHPLIRLGNLYTRRDYIYVEDTAACLASMVEADDLKGLEFFNVGTGREYDVRSIVEHIARIRGCSLELQADPTLARKMDRHSQLADITKAVSRLNWRPLYSLEEALKRTVAQERP